MEPYIEQGGILGEKLTVNDSAASSVMRRTGLRRHVVVTKGYGIKRFQTVGSEELALLKSRILPFSQRQLDDSSKVSDLTHDQSTWVIRVHDQQLHNVVDEWMKKKFNSDNERHGQQLYSERYATEMSSEVTRRISHAFFNEKRNIAVASSLISSGLYALLAGCAAGIYFTSESIKSFIDGSFSDMSLLEYYGFFARNASQGIGSILGGVTVLAVNFRISKKISDISLLRNWEYYLPNLSIATGITGKASLLINSRRLVVLKENK